MNEQIEAIRAEIERRKKKYLFDDQPMTIGRYYEDRDLLSFIDSLPEEPAPKGYDEAYLNECIAKASKTWEGVDVAKYMDEVRGNCPKLSDTLEEAARLYAIPHYMKDIDVNHIEEYPYDTGLEAAFKAGAEWMAGQGVILNLSIDEFSCGAYNACVEQGLTSEDDVIIQVRKV